MSAAAECQAATDCLWAARIFGLMLLGFGVLFLKWSSSTSADGAGRLAPAAAAEATGPTPAPTFVDVAGVGPLTYEDYMHAAKAARSEGLWWIDDPKRGYWEGLANRLAMTAITAEK